MYRIVITDHFKKQLKKINKKDREIKQVVKMALRTFNKKVSASIGNGIFKLRIKGLQKGKSGGYRLYVFLIEIESLLAPICIYTKNETESITASELNNHLEEIMTEINQEFV